MKRDGVMLKISLQGLVAERTVQRKMEKYVSSVQKEISNLERGLHPTQKPTKLFGYLINTYTNKGDTVVDCCAGSGTTAISCLNKR